MTVKDLLTQDIDIDVCDNYDESCYIAFCGPAYLTEEGLEAFGEVLDYGIELRNDIVIINVDEEGMAEDVADKRVAKARELLFSMAGYCSSEDYDKWFADKPVEPTVSKENNKTVPPKAIGLTL